MKLVSVTRRLFLRGAAGLVVSPACAARLGRSSGIPREAGVLRVLTLNLAHGRARAWVQTRVRSPAWYRRNLDVVARMLERERPDIVALQEAELGSRWAGMFDHVAYLARRADLALVAATPYMHEPHHHRYGTALLANGEALATGGAAFRECGRWTKGYTFARLRLNGLELTVATLHLDHASRRLRRRQALELADVLAREPGPYVVLGDFNASWRAERGPVRELARRLDLHAHRPDDLFPSTFPLLGRRIDWILVSRELEFVGHHVLDEDRLSDHRAVLADLRVA